MSKSITFDKSKAFALRIIRLYNCLKVTHNEFVLSKQILRAGTSIGANIAEAEFAISTKDFLSKLYIARKEAAETKYWLDLLNDAEYITKEQFDSINSDCEEIIKLLTSITKTTNLNNTKNQKLTSNYTLVTSNYQ